jgi:hypothetical protein
MPSVLGSAQTARDDRERIPDDRHGRFDATTLASARAAPQIDPQCIPLHSDVIPL